MKWTNGILIFLLMVRSSSLYAQDTGTFEITKKGSNIGLSGSDVTKSYSSIEIKFDKGFRNKLIEIWSEDKSQIAALKDKKFGKRTDDIQEGTNGFIITIQSNHKIKQCPDCDQEVPDNFTIKLDNFFYGPFHLKPKDIPLSGPNLASSGLKTKLYKPGFILYDALYTYKALKTNSSFDTVRMILENYDLNATNINNNNLLKEILKGVFSTVQGKRDVRADVPVLTKANLASAIGGLDVTNIVDGFSKFIVKRTKQELSIAFFDQFKKDLDKFPDISTVFPQTYRALYAIGDEIYQYEAYIQTLRESFEKDLATLPANLPSIMENHSDYFNHHPNLKAVLNTAFYFAQSIQDKQHPGTILQNFPISNLEGVTNPNTKPFFQTLSLLSTSLKSNVDGDRYWAPNTDIKRLFSTDENTLLKLYLGLLEQKAKSENIVFRDSATRTDYPLYKIIDSSFNNDLSYNISYLKNLVQKIQILEMKIMNLKKFNSDSLLLENFYSVISGSFDLLKSISQIEDLPGFPKDLHLQDLTKKYIEVAQIASDIVIDVNRRNYSSAIVNVMLLYKDSQESDGLSQDVINKIFKYGSFMAVIVQAKNSDDVASAIEAVALPSGSARIKRESFFNISLNAYCGGFVGQNWTKLWSKPQFSYGLTVPVGVALSWGVKHSSLSVFASIVDLGSVTAFRFSNDTARIAKITLKDIISPGLFFSYGFPRCPISINIGGQLAPFLTSVNSTGNNLSESRMLRFSAGICVDIPILNLNTRSKR